MKSVSISAVVFAHAPYAKFLPGCLESIARQSYPPAEIIVLSDGSEAISAVVRQFDQRVSCVGQGSEHFFVALNQVATSCSGTCVALMDSDDLYNPHHLKVLAELFQKYPDTGLAFDNVEYFADSYGSTASVRNGAGDERNLIISKVLAQRLISTPLTVQDIFVDNLVTGPSSLLSKEAFIGVGGYDRNALVVGDLHLFYRIGAYYGIRYADYVGVKKRVHSLSTTQENPHYEFGIKSLENIRDAYPEIYRRIGPRVFNKKLGRKYFRAGLFYEKKGEIAKAQEMYHRAMMLRKLALRYYWEYLRLRHARRYSATRND
jgi:glycosyltransferase involved in cell wall biosynthesis